jgi:bacterioferritin-associated ferredoxin
MITSETYFSPENELKYIGSSQFKAFMSCEASALASIRGEYVEEKSTALLVGSYVDAYFEGTLDIFRSKNPEIFTKSGTLKSEYVQAEKIIQRIERDEMFMKYMSGEKQVIMTGEIEGVPVKIKIDSYHPGKCIVDLKVMRDFAPIWVDGQGKLPFVEAWGYDIQAGIYQEIERQSRGADAKPLPFFIAGATKQKTTRLKIISIPQETMDAALQIVRQNIKHFDDLKHGIGEPERCGTCDYCAETEVLTEIVDYREVGYRAAWYTAFFRAFVGYGFRNRQKRCSDGCGFRVG